MFSEAAARDLIGKTVGRRRIVSIAVVAGVITIMYAWVSHQLRVESRDQPVTEADLRILQRADALLKDPAAWNRHDEPLERCHVGSIGGEATIRHARRPARKGCAVRRA